MCVCVCVCVCVRACVHACVRACVPACLRARPCRCVYVRLGVVLCCFVSADGLVVDVCQCCCLLMFVCLPLSRHFLCCKTW